MWSRLTRTAAVVQRHQRRTFLSEAYRCSDAWAGRLATPILQRVKPETFYYELEHRFQQQGKCSAIDIDIFANKLNDDQFVDEVADLMHKLRLTEETTNTLESTGHALVRVYLEHADIHELLFILNDRLSYGVFLDPYTANLALDKLIRAQDFTSAARIATLVMLQEELDNEITRTLSLYACVKYLQNPKSFDQSASEESAVDAAATAPAAPTTAGKKKKKEETKVRVKFIRNAFFDDHFDLRDETQLVGKTLSAIGKLIGGESAVGNSAQLLGLFHYGKYVEATELVRSIKASGGAVHQQVVETVVSALEKVSEPDDSSAAFGEAIKQLQSGAGLIAGDFEKVVCDVANDAVKRTEQSDITAQTKVRRNISIRTHTKMSMQTTYSITLSQIYGDWNTLRDSRLADEVQRLQRTQRLAEIERVTKDMDAEEQKLWFFENEDKLDLQIDSKKVFYRKRWFGKLKKPRVVDEGYVPPEIVRKLGK